ncbi:unnamed protein product [Urochloa humidicola]
MASCTKTARFLVLALLVVSAVILPSSVCHGIRGVELGSGHSGGSLNPNNRGPVCIGTCPVPGHSYTPRGGGHGIYPGTPDAPSNRENLHP